MGTLMVVLVVCLGLPLCVIIREALRRKGSVRTSLKVPGLGFTLEAGEETQPRRKRAGGRRQPRQRSQRATSASRDTRPGQD